jgi:peptidoglycan/xylan/chitin deacetylase (PgdA/CDA1 family)
MSHAFDNRSARAVFLCYHSIAERGAPYLSLPRETFARQLSMLRRFGYRSGGVEDLRRLAAGERLPRRTVFLTFDDGFRDNADVAMPLLREHGFHPLIFLLPRHVDTGAALDWPEVAEYHAREPELMHSLTWPQVEELAALGAEFGGHTITHPHLRDLDDESLGRELGESRSLVEQHLGSCEVLAYPFGEWDARVARAAEAAGYRFAFSLPQGPQPEGGALYIPRINVDRRDHALRFAVKLTPIGRRLLLSDLGERLRDLRKAIR